MKIKRYTARDMRQAMQKVREDQGPDAVILSSRRSDGMVEIVAAIDYDEALVREAVEPMRVAASEGVATVAAPRAAAPKPRAEAQPVKAASRAVEAPAKSASAAKPTEVVPTSMPAPTPIADAQRNDAARIQDEVGQLRRLLESQLSSLAWNDLDRRQPLRARVLRDLTRLGIESDVATSIVGDLPANLSQDQSRYLPLGLISRRLTVKHKTADLRGAIALVGATGAGKTTTLAKLAARHVQKHGRHSVALIGTDDFRVGAHDQLLYYGRALGVQTFTAGDAAELARLLDHLSDRDLVLIDTPGLTVRDARLPSVIDTLKANAMRVRATLVLPANLLPGSLEHSVGAFAALKPTGSILTKLDETPSLGAALSIVLRHRLALEYVTMGQRVPEDIAIADPRRLVVSLADASATAVPEEHVMAERFGRALLAHS